MEKVSIIIRALNEAKYLPQLFHGIRQQELHPHEVILVDSGSTDGSVSIAQTSGAKVVHIQKEDFSFGRALNIGCSVASGHILLFASGHVRPERSDWLSKITAPFADDRIGLVYGRQRGGETNKFSEHRLFERWFPNESTLNQSHYFCNNANCAVRRSLWESEPFDEDLTGLEDLAWAKTARNLGHRIAYQHEASILHYHEETWLQVRNRYRREAIALQKIEPKFNRNGLYFLRLGALNMALDYAAACHQGSFGLLPEIILFRFNQYFGAWDGNRDGKHIDERVLETFYYPPLEPHTAGTDNVSNSPKKLNY